MNRKLTSKRKVSGLTGLVAAGALLLAGCGSVSNEGGAASGGGDTQGGETAWQSCDLTAGAASVADIEGTGEDQDTDISMVAFNGWDESYASTHLLKAVLEEEGYTVNIQSLDAAPAFTGVAQGDIDILTDAWMPITHDSYITQYGDDLENLGCWYDNAKLTIAVNEDSPAQTIADLAEMGDEYGNTLYGIEAGAGLTKQTQEEAIPTYGLEDYEFVVSSTPAMLAEVASKTNADENVAVTLWRLHWAYSAYPMRDLEDPEGAMGGTEHIMNGGRPGLTEESPKVAQIVTNFAMTDEELAELEDLMMSEENFNGEDHDAAAAQWLEENPDFKDNLLEGTLG